MLRRSRPSISSACRDLGAEPAGAAFRFDLRVVLSFASGCSTLRLLFGVSPSEVVERSFLASARMTASDVFVACSGVRTSLHVTGLCGKEAPLVSASDSVFVCVCVCIVV